LENDLVTRRNTTLLNIEILLVHVINQRLWTGEPKGTIVEVLGLRTVLNIV
jgi:hypothetical protein